MNALVVRVQTQHVAREAFGAGEVLQLRVDLDQVHEIVDVSGIT